MLLFLILGLVWLQLCVQEQTGWWIHGTPGLGGDSPAAGATWFGWDVQDAEAAGVGLVVHPPAAVHIELGWQAWLLLCCWGNDTAWDLHQLLLEGHDESVLERWQALHLWMLAGSVASSC